MKVVILSSPADTRTRDIAQALMFCQVDCEMIVLPLDGRAVPEGLLLLLDEPGCGAPLILQDLRRRFPPTPVLVVSSLEERAYSARLIAYGATVVLPPGSEIDSVCAEVLAVQSLMRQRSGRQPLDTLQPFVAGVIESFEMMASVRVRPEIAGQCGDTAMTGDVTALIYLLGAHERVLAISCSARVAAALARKVLHDVVDEPDDGMIDDALGEMLNIIAGLVRSRQRAGGGDEFEITTPTVVRGNNHRLSFRPDLPGLEMVFSSPQGAFVMRLGHRAWGT